MTTQKPARSSAYPTNDQTQQVLKINTGDGQIKRLPACFFSGPRVVELWPPTARPVWAKPKEGSGLFGAPVARSPGHVIDAREWTQAMQQSTRPWVQQFGTTLGRVAYFRQLQDRLAQKVPAELRVALENLANTPDGLLLLSVVPQVALRSLGHTPLPSDPEACHAVLNSPAALLLWPAVLVAPSCCDESLVQAVQSAFSPEALRRLSDFCVTPRGVAFLNVVRELARDPLVMTADMTVRNNLQAGLQNELQAMHRDKVAARMREVGERLQNDVARLRDMLAERQDLFLRATPELDCTLIALHDVASLGEELMQGPDDNMAGDAPWDVCMAERVQAFVPRMHTAVARLLNAVGLAGAAGQTLALLFHPMSA